jgi:hypothetical protein
MKIWEALITVIANYWCLHTTFLEHHIFLTSSTMFHELMTVFISYLPIFVLVVTSHYSNKGFSAICPSLYYLKLSWQLHAMKCQSDMSIWSVQHVVHHLHHQGLMWWLTMRLCPLILQWDSPEHTMYYVLQYKYREILHYCRGFPGLSCGFKACTICTL